MYQSTFENPLPDKYHAIAATGYRGNGSEVEGKWPIYPEMAAAGLWTTPSQLILWAKEIQEVQQSQSDGLLEVKTVNEMLTPGMNDWGLGPDVSEHHYGHNGADEGFRATLRAWKGHPVAVVVMINSDNGTIIQEILLSIAQKYELPGISAEKRTIREQSNEQLQRFVGIYEFEKLGKADLKVKDNGLELKVKFQEEPIILLPETESTFFNPSTGVYFNFEIEDNQVVSFEARGFTATRLLE